jgi:predicted methyltransferase
MPRIASLALATLLSTGCAGLQTDAAAEADRRAAIEAAEAAEVAARAAWAALREDELGEAIAGSWRDPKNTVRDVYRHPLETLDFFGVNADQTVVEITPGGAGWYTEILAPYLRERGHYTAAMADHTVMAEGRARNAQQEALVDLRARLAKFPAQYDRVAITTFDPKQPMFAAPGTIDTVLTFRNVHNWVAAGTADAYFAAFHAALKPGGTLGVVDHRARPGTDLAAMKKSGYLTEALVIELATKAGFVLDARSEANANPKDTADHPNGVWTLPPSNRHDPEESQKYRDIGESDRMTLRFRKPAGE